MIEYNEPHRKNTPKGRRKACSPYLGHRIMVVLAATIGLLALLGLVYFFFSVRDAQSIRTVMEGLMGLVGTVALLIVAFFFLALSSHFRNTADIRGYLEKLTNKRIG